MNIVIYKIRDMPWQMCRVGHGDDLFYTTTNRPTKFEDGRSAAGWAKQCQNYARKVLKWEDAIFRMVSEYEFREWQRFSARESDWTENQTRK